MTPCQALFAIGRGVGFIEGLKPEGAVSERVRVELLAVAQWLEAQPALELASPAHWSREAKG